MGNLPFRQVHLDFHTSGHIKDIGKKFNKADFQKMLKLGHVNSITIFSKCHHGWAYHPTGTNEMHPHLDFDLLSQMIEACKEIGVQTPVYISTGLDEKLAIQHTEWLSRGENQDIDWTSDFQTPGYHTFCLNSPYLNIIAGQCAEVAAKFDVEGIFLDIVRPKLCYCQTCVMDVLNNGGDPNDEKTMWDYAQVVYKKYYETINKAIHDQNPKMRIFHNGGHISRGSRDQAFANTHLELESLPTAGWGYDHFPLSARYAQGLGMEFLGMTGKFHTAWGEFGGYKHPNAIKYEAALCIANGGKCSVGDQMHPLGYLDEGTYRLIGAAYSEVEAVEEFCDDVQSIADVAVFSDEEYMNRFGKNGKIASGVSRMVLEGKYLYDVVDVQSDFGKYKVLVLPDMVMLDDDLKAKVKAFTKNGGKVLATGFSGLGLDKKELLLDLGAKYKGLCEYTPSYFRPAFTPGDLYDTTYVFYGHGHNIEKTADGKELGRRVNPYFNRAPFKFCSHQHTPYNLDDVHAGMTQGSEGIYISWNVFEDYATKGSLILKETIKYALDQLLGDKKTLVTNLPAQGVTTLMHQADKNRFVSHMMYATPTRRGDGVEIIEDIIPIYDTMVQLLLDKKIIKAYLAKSKTPVAFEQTGNKVSYKVDKIVCSEIVVLEY